MIQIEAKGSKTNSQIMEIKHIFPTISLSKLKKNKLHASFHQNLLSEAGTTLFYVDFRLSHFLHLSNLKIPFNGNLLYCPITKKLNLTDEDYTEERMYIQISHEYAFLLN